MRRITWIFTVLLTLALLAAGCGDDNDDGGNGGGGGGGGGGALTLTADPGGAISWEPGSLSASAGSVIWGSRVSPSGVTTWPSRLKWKVPARV